MVSIGLVFQGYYFQKSINQSKTCNFEQVNRNEHVFWACNLSEHFKKFSEWTLFRPFILYLNEEIGKGNEK